MKGITLVQAFQYWLKMLAISVPVFVLMAVYGHYGKQLEVIDPELSSYLRDYGLEQAKRKMLPDRAPADSTWLIPFGPLTTRAAKAAAAALTNNAALIGKIPLRADLPADTRMTMNIGETNMARALATYAELTGRILLPRTKSLAQRIDEFFGGRLSRL